MTNRFLSKKAHKLSEVWCRNTRGILPGIDSLQLKSGSIRVSHRFIHLQHVVFIYWTRPSAVGDARSAESPGKSEPKQTEQRTNKQPI